MTVRATSRVSVLVIGALAASLAVAVPVAGAAVAARPTITKVAPATGPTSGGTHVRLIGTNFTNVKSVTFGGKAAAVFAISATHKSMTVTAPSSATQRKVSIVLRTAAGTATKASAFTYAASWTAAWHDPQTIAAPVEAPKRLSCPTTAHCYGMDRYGNFLESGSGGNWINDGSPSGDDAHQALSSCQNFPLGCASLSCPQVDWCLTVDDQGQPLVWSGSSWRSYPSLDPAGANSFDHTPAVSCASTTFCIVMDYASDWSTFDGSAWSPVRGLGGTPVTTAADVEQQAVYNDQPDAVSCAGDECLMTQDMESYQYVNGAWTNVGEELPTGHDGGDPGPTPTDLSCANVATSGTSLLCAVVGGATAVFSNGQWADWEKQSAVAVACHSDGRCLAVGGTKGFEYGNHSLAVDKHGWSAALPMPKAPPYDATAVACGSGSSCRVTLQHGFTNTFDLGTHTWSATTSFLAADDGISAVSCSITSSGKRYCLAGTAGPDVVGDNGGTWSAPVQAFDPDEQTAAVSCVHGTAFCMAIANNGHFLSKANHYAVYSSGKLTAHSMLTGTYRSLACWSRTGCYAVSQTRVLRWNGSVWSVAVNLTKRHLAVNDIACVAGDQACLAVTPGDDAFWINGTKTSATVYMNRKAADIHPVGVSCQSVHKCIAVTDSARTGPGGDVFSDTSMDWLPQGGLDKYAGEFYDVFRPVSCAPSATVTRCLAVGWGPEAQYDGAVHVVDSPIPDDYRYHYGERITSVTCPSTAGCYVGDSIGRLRAFS
jgi:hypothetical protein